MPNVSSSEAMKVGMAIFKKGKEKVDLLRSLGVDVNQVQTDNGGFFGSIVNTFESAVETVYNDVKGVVYKGADFLGQLLNARTNIVDKAANTASNLGSSLSCL